MPPIRVSVKALILEKNKILMTRNRDAIGDWYLLPGGGQIHGETLLDALKRECIEEIGAEVEVGAIRLVRDYIGRNHEFSEHDGDAHQIAAALAGYRLGRRGAGVGCTSGMA